MCDILLGMSLNDALILLAGVVLLTIGAGYYVWETTEFVKEAAIKIETIEAKKDKTK